MSIELFMSQTHYTRSRPILIIYIHMTEKLESFLVVI